MNIVLLDRSVGFELLVSRFGWSDVCGTLYKSRLAVILLREERVVRQSLRPVLCVGVSIVPSLRGDRTSRRWCPHWEALRSIGFELPVNRFGLVDLCGPPPPGLACLSVASACLTCVSLASPASPEGCLSFASACLTCVGLLLRVWLPVSRVGLSDVCGPPHLPISIRARLACARIVCQSLRLVCPVWAFLWWSNNIRNGFGHRVREEEPIYEEFRRPWHVNEMVSYPSLRQACCALTSDTLVAY